MQVAGVDGCTGGWIVVRVAANNSLHLGSVSVAQDFSQVLFETEHCAAVAIDVPIGLMDAGQRMADREARKVLGRRASCVFPSAIRPVLGITDYHEACNVSFAAQRKRIPTRAFALGLRSHQVDLEMSQELQRRVIEIHPEVSFWALNGGTPVPVSKRTPAGEYERLRLLVSAYSDDLSSVETPSGAAPDDFLDACVAAWTAARFARGEAKTLPEDPPLDSRGLRMEIVY